MQESVEGKPPIKSILKKSSAYAKAEVGCGKNVNFDEVNVLETFHPAGKKYGHMTIGEAKTPYNREYKETKEEPEKKLDAKLLRKKLRIAKKQPRPSFVNISEDEDEKDQKRNLEFERRRKKHYNEYEKVRLARKLIEEELGGEEDSEVSGSSGTRVSESSGDGRQTDASTSLPINVRDGLYSIHLNSLRHDEDDD